MSSETSPRRPVDLISVRGLTKVYRQRQNFTLFGRKKLFHAVDGVDLDIRRGETLGLVGESGSGKSTLGRLILQLTSISAGTVDFDGRDIVGASRSELRELRRKMQIVFQDPYSSLHPRMTVRQTIFEGLRAGGRTARSAMNDRAAELIQAVGLGPAHMDVHPHRLSGGQRQRVAIARALSVDPTFIVADEAVSALDVSIQAQILNLLADLQRDLGLTYLFVSHDLNVIRYLADRVAVMHRGRIVEQAPAAQLFSDPQHHYTRQLFEAMPTVDKIGMGSASAPKPEEVASAPTEGCQFFGRCPARSEICAKVPPPLRPGRDPEHLVACYHPATQPLDQDHRDGVMLSEA